MLILLILATFPLILFGVFLLFYKRKGKDGAPAWIATAALSDAAKDVHLSEYHKQTGKIGTKTWLLKYWRGQRSAFYAWFTWSFVGKFLLKAIISLCLIFSIDSIWPIYLLSAISIFYTIVAAIILWRCARNSTTFNKYFARIVAIFPVCIVIIDLLSV